MDWGMKNRLSRIINPKTGRTVMLAIDHGYFMGPTHGLEKPWETIKDLVPHADTLMLTRGILRNCVPPELGIPIVLRVSGGTSILNKNLLHEGVTVAMEDAVRLNAAGVAFSFLVGAEFERDTLLGLTQVIDQAQEFGIPVVAVNAVGKDMIRDTRYLGLSCRIAAELGASMVKTYYCEGFEKVVEGCPIPLVIAGGKKVPEKEALEMAYKAIHAGAVGVDMGRNIFQSSDPLGMIQAVKAVVHKNYTPEEAFEMFKNAKGTSVEKIKETYVTA